MTLPRYPAYKDSGVEWLGEVPEHWRVLPIKYLAHVDNSGCYGSDVGVHPVALPVATTAQIDKRGNFDVDRMPIRSFTKIEIDRYLCKPGDVLVVKSSGSSQNIISGKAGFITEDTPPFVFSNFLLRLVPNQKVAKHDFLYAWIASRLTKERVQRMVSTTTYPNLQVSEYVGAKICIPPISEQSTIAAFLSHETSKIDALIAEQKNLIALLKEKRQAVISHAVTKGLNPDVPMKDSGVEWLGEVPEHWEVRPLKYLVVFRSGGTPNKGNPDFWDGDVPWASAKDLKTEVLWDTIDHISEFAVQAGGADLVPVKTVLVVVRGMILARTFPVAIAGVPMAINQDLKALECHNTVQAHFLARLLQASSEESLRRIDEAGHGTKALRMDAWTSIQLPLPPIGEQKTIATVLDRKTTEIDALAREAECAIALLEERRTALISAAVTGKIDVRRLDRQEAA